MSRIRLIFRLTIPVIFVACVDINELTRNHQSVRELDYDQADNTQDAFTDPKDGMSVSDAGLMSEDMESTIDDPGPDELADAANFVDSEPVIEDMEIDDNPCDDAVPRSRCLIDRECITAGQPKVNNPCLVCLP